MYYIGHMGLFGGIWMLLFWTFFILFIIWLIAQNSKDRNKDNYENNNSKKIAKNSEQIEEPITILKRRLAKGDIDEKEFDKLKKRLN